MSCCVYLSVCMSVCLCVCVSVCRMASNCRAMITYNSTTLTVAVHWQLIMLELMTRRSMFVRQPISVVLSLRGRSYLLRVSTTGCPPLRLSVCLFVCICHFVSVSLRYGTLTLTWTLLEDNLWHLLLNTVADLGFGKGGCPIHQKGAPEGAKPLTCAPARGLGASPRKFENLDTLWFIFPASQGITNCMIECAFMTWVASILLATISVVHRERKVKIKLNLIRKLIKRPYLCSKIVNREAPCSAKKKNMFWKYVLFRKGHPKQRAGVRTPGHLLDPPLQQIHKTFGRRENYGLNEIKLTTRCGADDVVELIEGLEQLVMEEHYEVAIEMNFKWKTRKQRLAEQTALKNVA